MNYQRWGVVAVVAILLVSPAVPVLADSLTHQATSGVTYQTNSGVEVTLGSDREIAAVPFPDDRTFTNGSLVISGSDASVTATSTTFDGTPLTVEDVDVQASGELNITRTDLSRSVTVTSGDATVLQVQDYAVDNGSADLAYNSNNGLTVRLTGLPSVGVAAVDAGTGNPVDTAAVGSTGVATLELPAGTRNIRLETTPSELQVRNESAPSQLIDGNATLSARLFTGGPASDTVIERPVTNGTVSLDGVPKDEPLVITVKEEQSDFSYRRILLDSAVQTSSIYLLPAGEESAEVRFELRDETGRFSGESTRLFVEKPITRDFDGDGTNETNYEVISGDRIGADSVFPTVLIDETRYRIRVENDAGETRVLGSYTVRGPTITTLPIGEVEFTEDVSEGAALQASLREAADGASHDHEVRLVYLDPEGTTDEIEIAITNSSGASIRPTSTEQLNGTTSAYVETYPLDTSFNPDSDTATVTVEATQGLTTETFEETVGAVAPIGFGALDSQVLELIGLVSIVGVAGLLVIVRPAAAALITPGWAGLLTLTEVVAIPMAGVILAGVVGILATLGASGRL
jgi:hypothetical protein